LIVPETRDGLWVIGKLLFASQKTEVSILRLGYGCLPFEVEHNAVTKVKKKKSYNARTKKLNSTRDFRDISIDLNMAIHDADGCTTVLVAVYTTDASCGMLIQACYLIQRF
jgi:hypothetical protein